MGNGNQKSPALRKYREFGLLPRTAWLHLFANYLSVKELREVVFLSKAFSKIAIEAYPLAKKTRLDDLTKMGALKKKIKIRVDKKSARAVTFLSNGHMALLSHDIYPEVFFFDREGNKLDSISAWTFPVGAEKQRYDNIADMAPLPKARLALLDSGKKQIVVVSQTGTVSNLIPLAYKNPLAIAASADGFQLHVADQLEQNISTYSIAEGKLVHKFNFPIPTTLTGLTTDSAGNLLVPNPKTASIRIINSKTGELVREIGDGPGTSEKRIKDPRGVDIDPKGRLYIADITQQLVFIMDSEGRVIHAFGKNTYFKASHAPLQVRLRDDGGVAVLVQSLGVIVF